MTARYFRVSHIFHGKRRREGDCPNFRALKGGPERNPPGPFERTAGEKNLWGLPGFRDSLTISEKAGANLRKKTPGKNPGVISNGRGPNSREIWDTKKPQGPLRARGSKKGAQNLYLGM